jgi:predicted SprT family Zn-dependent metalloprotease
MPDACTEKFTVEGSEVCIVDESIAPPAFKRLLISLIRTALESNKYVAWFVLLRIVLKNAASNIKLNEPRQWLVQAAKLSASGTVLGSCPADEFLKSQEGPTVNLFVDSLFGYALSGYSNNKIESLSETEIQKTVVKRLPAKLVETLSHEIVHLVQFQQKRYAEKLVRWSELVNKMIKRAERASPFGVESAFSNARFELTLLTQNVWCEGLAKMFEKLRSYDTETSAEYYYKANQSAQSIARAFAMWQMKVHEWISAQKDARRFPLKGGHSMRILECLNELDKATAAVSQVFRKSSYNLGLHMVYKIAYAYHIGPEDIESYLDKYLKLNRRELFKLYEEACAQNNVQPVFSFSSNAGILDYSRMVNELEQLAEWCGIKQKV